jgi:ParB family chromosome partitioning protein
MSRKPLGRGLGALLGESQVAVAKAKSGDELFELDVDAIYPNAEQPRTRFAEADLIDLARSIEANGIVQPILVRRRGTRFELIAGERRWRAAQRAGLKKIPAVVRDVADDKRLELSLIENIQRKELTAIEEASAYQKLIETLGLTQEMVASRVGKDRTFVTNYLRLLKLPEDIQNLLTDEKLSVGHARALLMLEGIDQQRKLARKIIEMSLSVRETEKAVKRMMRGAPPVPEARTASKTTDANHKAAETKMRRKFATQVRIIADRKGGGKIEIDYYSENDLDRIYRLMIPE